MIMRLNKEKIKTVLLIVLVAASLFQIGIHWSQQGQGFPFRFLARLFNYVDIYASVDVDSIKHQYFVPERIIVSRSPTALKWKLRQGDPYFNELWEDVSKNYLPEILGQKPSKILPKEEWPQITSVRCIRFDLSTEWPSDIILWLENKNDKKSTEFKSVNSIAILPEEDVNKAVNTVYIFDGYQIYKYSINIKRDFLPKDEYTKLAEKLSYENRLEYDTLSEMAGFDSSEDIFVPVYQDSSALFPTLSIEIPESLQLNEENFENEVIAESLLKNQKDSLMVKYNENSGQIIFTDTENLYRLYGNGVLEYKYLPTSVVQAGEVSAAFSKALSFIELRRDLLGDVDIVLSKIISDKYYEFHFDYEYNGVPVFYTGLNSKERISSPIVIKATSERVIECVWVMRSFTESDTSRKYNLSFSKLLNDQIPQYHPEIMTTDDIFFERMEPGYVFGASTKTKVQGLPHWIISNRSEDFFIPLSKEG